MCAPSSSGDINQAMDLLTRLVDVTIESSVPAYDEHEARNLLLANSPNGFMAERFIKPPVRLTVKFPCPVRLKSIYLDGNSGSSISTGFEIMSYSLGKNRPPDKLPVFKPIGRMRNITEGRVLFTNHRYSGQWCNTGDLETAGCQTSKLSSHDFSLLNNARYLSISITQTLSCKVPALRKMAIIGWPCDMSYVAVEPVVTPLELNESQPRRPEIEIPVKVRQTADFASGIPDDFLDSLTHEIMALPVVLPSGHTVDQSSLDKHVAGEARWGRQPSDPFTGLVFTSQRKPIINQKLKERIDHFVLVNNLSSARTLSAKRSNTVASSTQQSSSPPSKRLKQVDDRNELLGPTCSTSSKPAPLSQRIQLLLTKSSGYRTVELPSTSSDSLTAHKCTLCDTTPEHVAMYKLRCQHFVCRHCVTDKRCATGDTICCSVCGQTTETNKVARHHPISTSTTNNIPNGKHVNNK